MKIFTAIFISAVLVGGSAASADMLSGIAGGSPLKYFDLQKEFTASDIPVSELQKEMAREVPAVFAPSKRDKPTRSPRSDDSSLKTDKQRDLI